MTTPNDHGVTVTIADEGKRRIIRVGSDVILYLRVYTNGLVYTGVPGCYLGDYSPAQLRAIGEAFIAAADEFAAEGGA
jgi:hypothetical protein